MMKITIIIADINESYIMKINKQFNSKKYLLHPEIVQSELI